MLSKINNHVETQNNFFLSTFRNPKVILGITTMVGTIFGLYYLSRSTDPLKNVKDLTRAGRCDLALFEMDKLVDNDKDNWKAYSFMVDNVDNCRVIGNGSGFNFRHQDVAIKFAASTMRVKNEVFNLRNKSLIEVKEFFSEKEPQYWDKTLNIEEVLNDLTHPDTVSILELFLREEAGLSSEVRRFLIDHCVQYCLKAKELNYNPLHLAVGACLEPVGNPLSIDKVIPQLISEQPQWLNERSRKQDLTPVELAIRTAKFPALMKYLICEKFVRFGYSFEEYNRLLTQLTDLEKINLSVIQELKEFVMNVVQEPPLEKDPRLPSERLDWVVKQIIKSKQFNFLQIIVDHMLESPSQKLNLYKDIYEDMQDDQTKKFICKTILELEKSAALKSSNFCDEIPVS